MLFFFNYQNDKYEKKITEDRGNQVFMHNGSLKWSDFHSGCFDNLYPNEKCIYPLTQ